MLKPPDRASRRCVTLGAIRLSMAARAGTATATASDEQPLQPESA